MIKKTKFNQDYYIVDTTLRDGEQTPGVAFTTKQKIEIAKALDDLGVDVIEAGIPIMGEEEIKTLKAINNLNLKAILLVWNRMNIDDIKASLKCGIKNLHITVPASDLHIKKKLNMTRKEVIEKMKRVIEFALLNNCSVSVGAEDASRADKIFLEQLFKTAVKLGATRIRYADTIGKEDPFSIYDRIKYIKSKINVPLDYHGHNDLGMATANALAAYKAGAEYISCSINGLGERAGNTSLEEIVMSLYYTQQAKSMIDIKKLMYVSKLVEEYSGKKLHDGKPIVGKDVFSHESGIHVDGLLKNEATYQYVDPQVLNRKKNIIIGKFSGTSSIIYKMSEKGYEINKMQAKRMLRKLRLNNGSK